MQIPRYRWFAWWYLSLALVFLLLGTAHLLQHYRALDVILHAFVAIGFAALSWIEFRARERK